MAPARLAGVCILTLVGLLSTPSTGLGEEIANTRLLTAANAANLRGAWAQAEALYAQVVAQDPKSVDGLSGLAYVLAEQGRLADAAVRYRAAFAASPRDPWILYNLATVVDATQPRRALGLWNQYIAVAGNTPAERAYVARAQARIRQLTGP